MTIILKTFKENKLILKIETLYMSQYPSIKNYPFIGYEDGYRDFYTLLTVGCFQQS